MQPIIIKGVKIQCLVHERSYGSSRSVSDPQTSQACVGRDEEDVNIYDYVLYFMFSSCQDLVYRLRSAGRRLELAGSSSKRSLPI